jgi:hypothetical protein
MSLYDTFGINPRAVSDKNVLNRLESLCDESISIDGVPLPEYIIRLKGKSKLVVNPDDIIEYKVFIDEPSWKTNGKCSIEVTQ